MTNEKGAAVAQKTAPKVAITYARGWHLTFSNGVTVSVQFGPGNYCQNRHLSIDDPSGYASRLHALECPSAEVAVWDRSGKWITKDIAKALGLDESDDVLGYVNPDTIARIIHCAMGEA